MICPVNAGIVPGVKLWNETHSSQRLIACIYGSSRFLSYFHGFL